MSKNLHANRFRRRYARRFLAGKGNAVCRNATTGRRYRVTFRWGVAGRLWAAGRHTGEDYACPVGSLAIAPVPGRVSRAGWDDAYGNFVVLRHPSGKYDLWFCHLRAPSEQVVVGTMIPAGTVIGYTGSTGNVTGPHLHFEVRRAGGGYGTDVHPRHGKRAAR